MKSLSVACLLALLVSGTLRAGPQDLAIVAAMKLPDAANYSWLTSVDDDARSYTIEGQTDRATDYSLVTMPVVSSIRRRAGTGTANSGNRSTVVFKGDEKFVVQVDSTWRTPDELAATKSASRGDNTGGYPGEGGGPRRRARRGGGGLGIGGDEGNGREAPPYSNLQKTLSRPHEEVAIIVATASDLKIDGDVVSGTLSDTAAKLLLVHPGQKEITPLKAGGTFRFWVREGVLTKYEVKLDGTLAVMNRGDRHEVEVHQTAVTEIKNVGTTKFEVPEDAKKKLGA